MKVEKQHKSKEMIIMFKKITKEFLEENDINVAEDFNNKELERLFRKEFEEEMLNETM